DRLEEPREGSLRPRGDGHVDKAPKHLIQEERGVVLRAHPVARENEDGGVGPGLGQEATERRVDRDVNVADGVADGKRRRGVVTRVLGVVNMPALVTDAMALCKHGEKEVPSAALEKVRRELRL